MCPNNNLIKNVKYALNYINMYLGMQAPRFIISQNIELAPKSPIAIV